MAVHRRRRPRFTLASIRSVEGLDDRVERLRISIRAVDGMGLVIRGLPSKTITVKNAIPSEVIAAITHALGVKG